METTTSNVSLTGILNRLRPAHVPRGDIAGGDENGWSLRSASYGANALNQYTNRTVPGYVDVTGVSYATNTVQVNSQTAYRKGEYFRKELTVDNSTPRWTNIIASATGQPSVTGNVYLAASPEQFGYDAHGNLTNDGRWAYTWDAEKRLVKMEPSGTVAVPDGAKRKLDFIYDSHGRRIQKAVSTWNGLSWSLILSNRFLYDGWNLIAELNATNNSLIRSHLWGLDLSGSLQGAGGVRGLLAVSDSTSYFPAYDGNGDMMALVSSTNASLAAQYEYAPFGEVLRATGPMAKANPFRFSTKYQDDETDLLYYGYRYEKNGRWISKDPVAEPGFLLTSSPRKALKPKVEDKNPYACNLNDSFNGTDYLGLNPNIKHGTKISVDLDHGGGSSITVGPHFTQQERVTALRALCLIRKLLGSPPYFPPFSETYWASFSGKTAVNGVTYEGSIFIDRSRWPAQQCSLPGLVAFGSTLAHEADHFLDKNSTDAPGGPNDRIDIPAQNAMLKALKTPACGCCNHEWHYRNLMEKYACECGVRPCGAPECPQ
jgi:RHS repeat-associated protein